MSEMDGRDGNDSTEPAPEQEAQTRREFVRRMLLTSSYVVPAVVSFTTEGVYGGQSPSGMMMFMMSPPGMGMPLGMGMMMGSAGDLWMNPPPRTRLRQKISVPPGPNLPSGRRIFSPGAAALRAEGPPGRSSPSHSQSHLAIPPEWVYPSLTLSPGGYLPARGGH